MQAGSQTSPALRRKKAAENTSAAFFIQPGHKSGCACMTGMSGLTSQPFLPCQLWLISAMAYRPCDYRVLCLQAWPAGLVITGRCDKSALRPQGAVDG